LKACTGKEYKLAAKKKIANRLIVLPWATASQLKRLHNFFMAVSCKMRNLKYADVENDQLQISKQRLQSFFSYKTGSLWLYKR